MNNSKVHMVFYLWKRQFIESLLKKQTICGYLLGGVLMMVFSVQYLNYAGNRSIQCLEPMIVTMINPIASLLLFIGLILILPDPPFVNNRSAMMFYRSTRKTWMCGMLCYMASHIILYYAFLLTVSMVFTMSHSYTGNIWSRALIRMVSVEKWQRYLNMDCLFRINQFLNIFRRRGLQFLYTFYWFYAEFCL